MGGQVRRTLGPRRGRAAAALAALAGLAVALAPSVGHAPAAPAAAGEAEVPAAPSLAPTVRPAALADLGRKDKVHLAYFVPKDRKPVADWSEKIAVVMTFVNDVYARDLRSKGYETAGLDFEFKDGKPLVHLLAGKETAAEYNGDPKFDGMRQWSKIVPEVEAALGPAGRNLYVVFTETYTEGPWKFEFPGGFALGARFSATGGVGMFSAWILRDEFCATTVEGQLKWLADETPVRGRTALGCGRPDSPRFEFIEDGFGAVAHELGHAFGLTHDCRADQIDIMGNGFRELRQNYLGPQAADGPRIGFGMDAARLLRWSRFLAGDADLADTEPPQAVIEHPTKLKAGATTFHLGGTVTDDKALAGILYFSPRHDWVLGGSDLCGRQVRLNQPLIVPPLEKGAFEVVILIIDRGGNIGTVNVKMAVE